MHSILSRLNAIFAFTITVVGVLGIGLYLTTFLYTQNGQVKLNVVDSKLSVKSATEYTAGRKKNDLGFVNLDLDVDLSHLFNWNVKQLFLYITAEYKTKQNAFNQVVLWDKIIKKGENTKLNLKSIKTKYNFWDDGDGLRGNKNVTLYLSWNIIPNVGALPLIPADGRHSFSFPNEYTTSSA